MGEFVGGHGRGVETMIGLWAIAYDHGISERAEDIRWWLEADGVAPDDRRAVGRWMGRKVVWEGHEVSRMHQMFTWM